MANWKIQASDKRKIAPVEQVPGAFRRVMADGDRMMIIEWTMKAGTAVPEHNHPHEQSGYVVKGEMVFRCDGKVFHLKPGMAYVVSGGTSHGAHFPVASVVVDIFSPPREDYRGALASNYTLNGEAVAAAKAARKAAPKKAPARKPAARKRAPARKAPAKSRKR